jgi:alkylation response protein AidB-like acyl-CoA dehydrogenase
MHVRTFVQARIAPMPRAGTRSHHLPAEELRGLAELGCYGVAVPPEWDGAGLDYLALALILRRSPPATAPPPRRERQQLPGVLHPHGLGQRRAEGALAQARWRAARCWAPSASPSRIVGSQADGLRTTAVRDGDHYVLNGVKQFITSGRTATSRS